MDITVQKAISASRNFEKQLSSQLSAPNVSYALVEETLKEICQACSTALLQDFEAASTQHAESRLWDSHQKVNSFYRAELQKIKKAPEPNSVARRKLESSYLRSIKTAQKFYRGYIHGLASAHGGIAELERIARKVPYDGKSKSSGHVQKANPHNILISCHSTLIHLGDLSRYRETELAEKEKDWAPAVGFYDLAISVLPSSGMSYNQLAVIALADGNLFRAVYQLYRSLSTEDPHPQAEANLRRAFFKVQAAWKAGELKMNIVMTAGAGLPSPMIAWYLRVLSLYYHGKGFSERDEMENEVINQLKVDMRKRPTEGPPHRLVKINIAAGYAAQDRLVKAELSTEDLMQSYLFFLRLNIKTFHALMEILQEELDSLELGKVASESLIPRTLPERLTPAMRRILPVVRLYSLWLRKNIIVLTKGLDASFATMQEDMWTIYAKCLSSIIQAFPSEQLSTVEYLLEEDEDTIGFKPLHCDENKDIWYSSATVKPRWYEIAGRNRDASSEMLSRITGIVVDALKLSMDETTPIVLDRASCNILYQPSATLSPQRGELLEPMTTSDSRIPPDDMSYHLPDKATKLGLVPPPELEDDSIHSDIEAQRMVDSIVGLEELPTDLSGVDHRTTSSLSLGIEGSMNGSSSPFPVGTHTANDLLVAVRNYSQTHRKSGGPRGFVPAFPGLGFYSPVPSELQSPTIASKSLPSPNFSSTILDNTHATPQPTVKVDPDSIGRLSPLAAGLGGRHSRMNSNDSSSSALNGVATWSSYNPTDSLGQTNKAPQRRSLYTDRGLGNGTFGDLLYRREGNVDSKGASLVNSPSLSTTKNDAWGRTSFGFGSTSPLVESSAAEHWQPPAWNIPNVNWGTPSETSTPNMKNGSKDFSYPRPVT